MQSSPNSSAALPNAELSAKLSDWLYGARVRLLRQAAIARRSRILELGAGWGHAAGELHRRSGGEVTLVDCDPLTAAHESETRTSSVRRVLADAEQLPFEDGSFDLVFAQFCFLWIAHPERAAAETHRVLAPDGAIALIEPDFGGLMEYPAETELRPVWIDALHRAGAHPTIGRELPAMLTRAGFRAQVSFLDRLEPPDASRFDFLQGLPMTPGEQDRIVAARQAAGRHGSQCIAHLPCWLVLGVKTAHSSSAAPHDSP